MKLPRGLKKRALAVAEEVVSNYNNGSEEDAIIARAFEIINRRYARGEIMNDPATAGIYFKSKLSHLEHEVFAAIFLDTRHRILAYEELFKGSLDGADVHPREVAKRCLHHNAAAVIFGHNHPSGNPDASAADRAVTARLKASLALVEVRVLDHFIIGNGNPTSMAQRGWI